MLPLSRQKRKSKDQSRTAEGKYTKRARKYNQNLSASSIPIDNNYEKKIYNKNDYDQCGADGAVIAIHNTDSFDSFNDGQCIDFEFLSEKEWGDDDDSRWDDLKNREDENKIYQKLKGLDLVQKNDNKLENTKRRPYKIGKTPKSTHYDKYGPNGSFTKAAAGTKKITSFFMKNNTQITDSQSSEPIKIDTLSDSESEVIDPYTYRINEKFQELKEQLEKHHDQLIIFEYNYKRAIFEYLTLLNDNNRHGRINASLEVAQKVFIDGGA